jgi:hypothetical protein
MARTKKYHGTIERRPNGSWRLILYVEGVRHSIGPREYPELLGATRKEVEEFSWRVYKKLVSEAKREAADARLDAAQAEAAADALAGDLPEGEAGDCTFSEPLRQFETIELPTLAKGTQDAYRDSFKPIRAYFIDRLGDPLIDRISARHIRAFLS